MRKEINISRRKFFKGLITISLVILGISWVDMINRMKQTLSKRTKHINPNSINNGVNFKDDVIVVKNNEELKVFSSKCPHLGCIINHVENEQFVCPCHGSKFNMKGSNIKGPAASPLAKLDYKIDNNNNLIVELT